MWENSASEDLMLNLSVVYETPHTQEHKVPFDRREGQEDT